MSNQKQSQASKDIQTAVADACDMKVVSKALEDGDFERIEKEIDKAIEGLTPTAIADIEEQADYMIRRYLHKNNINVAYAGVPIPGKKQTKH
jgi:hypothetical protein